MPSFAKPPLVTAVQQSSHATKLSSVAVGCCFFFLQLFLGSVSCDEASASREPCTDLGCPWLPHRLHLALAAVLSAMLPLLLCFFGAASTSDDSDAGVDKHAEEAGDVRAVTPSDRVRFKGASVTPSVRMLEMAKRKSDLCMGRCVLKRQR